MLISVLFGVVLRGEKLGRAGWWAVALATIGVAVLTVEQGVPPWIALGLAFSFAIYGLIRKQVQIDPLTGILAETLWLAPLALLLRLAASPVGVRGEDRQSDIVAMRGTGRVGIGGIRSH